LSSGNLVATGEQPVELLDAGDGELKGQSEQRKKKSLLEKILRKTSHSCWSLETSTPIVSAELLMGKDVIYGYGVQPPPCS
jgi:hypothetical protein